MSPHRFLEINMAASIPQVDYVEKFVKSCSLQLLRLNLSYVSLGMNATRTLNVYLLKHNVLKDLNLMRCGLNNQSARYIVDALARNVTIRHLNISQNDLSSTLYEFGIKLAALLSRHPTLLHANFSSIGLTKEETMLVIAAMSTSKSFLALHLSNNSLPYYDRVFMRSYIASRVQYNSKFRRDNEGGIKLNKDRF